MPAKSVAQQQAMAIAEHHPENLYPRNRALLKMSKNQLHDFSTISHKGLPQMKKSKMKHAESKETPEMESKYHSKGFLKKALSSKSAKKAPRK